MKQLGHFKLQIPHIKGPGNVIYHGFEIPGSFQTNVFSHRARDPAEPSTDLYGHHAPALHPPKVLARNMRAHELREWQSQVQHIKNMAIDLQCDTPGHVYIKAFVDMAGFHVLLFHSLEHATRETKDRG